MNLKTNKILVILIFLIGLNANAQKVSGIYKIDNLLNRLKNKDTTYVVNFWATWCKPCIKELPAFDSLKQKDLAYVKIILVSLDFKEDIEKKVNPFLQKNKIKCEVVLLDEVNGNDYINKISNEWTGAIPATYFKNKKKEIFAEQSVTLKDLELNLEELKKK